MGPLPVSATDKDFCLPGVLCHQHHPFWSARASESSLEPRLSFDENRCPVPGSDLIGLFTVEGVEVVGVSVAG